MNPTLYTQLSPLGFAEWLEKNFETLMSLDEWFKDADKEEINSSERTVMNALAFRFLREEKGIFFEPIQHPQNKFRYGFEYEIGDKVETMKYGVCDEMYQTYELSEHYALNKALEILSKGGDDE